MKTKRLIDTLGRKEEYILAPGHTIQPDFLLENIPAIYDVCKEICK